MRATATLRRIRPASISASPTGCAPSRGVGCQREGPSMPVTDGPLTPFAEGIWVDTAPVRFLGMQLTTTMTVLRLGDGNLLLYSPVALTQARQSAIEALGPVAHLYAPNLFH